MPNIIPLVYIDPHDLIASLPRRMGLFKGNRITILKGKPNGSELPASIAKWPELKAILELAQALGDKIEFGGVSVDLLPPGDWVDWELPGTAGYFETFNRLVMAVRTNPGVMHYSGVESAHLQHGVVTLVNQRVVTSAINIGETAAIMLVVDTRRVEG